MKEKLKNKIGINKLRINEVVYEEARWMAEAMSNCFQEQEDVEMVDTQLTEVNVQINRRVLGSMLPMNLKASEKKGGCKKPSGSYVATSA